MPSPARRSRGFPPSLSAGFLALVAALFAHRAPSGAAFADRDVGESARQLLDEAYGRRHFYDDDFPGFEANISCVFGNEKVDGQVRVRDARDMEIDLPRTAARLWVREQLSIIISHRTRPPERDAKSLRLEEDDGHPLGRKITVKDRFRTSFRVRDGRIREVRRDLPPIRFVVSILEYARAGDGKEVPRSLTASYFDSATGRLLRTFVFHDTYRDVGKYSLPVRRVAVGASDEGSHTVSFELSDHELLAGGEDL